MGKSFETMGIDGYGVVMKRSFFQPALRSVMVAKDFFILVHLNIFETISMA